MDWAISLQAPVLKKWGRFNDYGKPTAISYGDNPTAPGYRKV